MPGILEGFDLEQPSDASISAIFESTLFDCNSQESNSQGQVIAAKLLPEHFRFCLLGNNSNESVKRVFCHFPVLTFAGQRVEFRTTKPDIDSRMIYTDELPIFNFICSHLRDAISTVNIPVDSNSTPKELHFIKQLSLFDALSEIAFFQRSSIDALDDEVDLLSEEQLQLYSELISRCVKSGTLKVLRMPGMTLPKCLNDLALIKMEHLYIKYDEADFLLEMDQDKILKADNLHIKANYFKPSKLFSKIESENVYLVIRFKFCHPKEEKVTPSPFVKHLFCKINYTTNLEEVFDYLNSGFPELETFEVETNWGISSLCSFETFNAAEKLTTSMKDCFRVISRIESSGLRAKSKGMKAKTLLRVRLLMPHEDTTFFADKNAAKKLRETIVLAVEGEFGKIPESETEDGEKAKEMSITLENGVKRFQKFSDHFLILESSF